MIPAHAKLAFVASPTPEAQNALSALVAAHGQHDVADADLIVTPELSIIGYPPEDLVLKPALAVRAAAMLAGSSLQWGYPGAPPGRACVIGGGLALLQPAARPGAVAGGSADSHPADAVRGTILLFTGVRYERLPDPAEPGLPAPERRCRR